MTKQTKLKSKNYYSSKYIFVALEFKRYQMSNHLGNVLAVVTDKKLPISENQEYVEYYLSELVHATDYSPFGVELDCQTALGLETDYDLIEEDVIYSHFQNTELDNNGNLESIGPSSPWGHYGARGQQVVMQGEYIEHEIGNEGAAYNHNVFVGLAYNFTDYHFASIKYAWYFYQSGSVSMWEDGSNIGWVNWSHVPGDKYRIERKDGNIYYYRNNILTGTVLDDFPNSPMTIVTALQKGNSKVYNLKVGKLHGNNLCSKDTDYRYGFGGHEKDDEVKGSGNHLSFGDYGLDTRLGRRLNLDPLATKFPGESPFLFAGNSPLYFIDRDGLVKTTYRITIAENGNKTVTKHVDKDYVEKVAVTVPVRTGMGIMNKIENRDYDVVVFETFDQGTGAFESTEILDGQRTLLRTASEYFSGPTTGGMAFSSSTGVGGAKEGGGDGRITNIDDLIGAVGGKGGTSAPSGKAPKQAAELLKNFIGTYNSFDKAFDELGIKVEVGKSKPEEAIIRCSSCEKRGENPLYYKDSSGKNKSLDTSKVSVPKNITEKPTH